MAIYNVTATHVVGFNRPDRVLATTTSLTEASKLANHFLAQDRHGVQDIRVVQDFVQEGDAQEMIRMAQASDTPTSMADVKPLADLASA